jgi:hypothetical protein
MFGEAKIMNIVQYLFDSFKKSQKAKTCRKRSSTEKSPEISKVGTVA